MRAKIQINEAYDNITIQGEGVEVGWPATFLRVQNCPVKCVGCDSAQTYDGTEKPKFTWGKNELNFWLDSHLEKHPGIGLVVTGGEPLLHFRNEEMVEFLEEAKQKTWLSLETSGFFSPKLFTAEDTPLLYKFLTCFKTVHCSPKVTPCLHGIWEDEQLLTNIPTIMKVLTATNTELAFKLVVKNEADIAVVKALDDRFEWKKQGYKVFLMPYGNNPQEIIDQSIKLVPILSKYGYILSPRLHSIFWGNKREI